MNIVAAVIGLALVGCISASEVHPQDVAAAQEAGPTLVYFKDARTGLCFAGRGLLWNQAVMASVPCSEAVERVIAEQAREVPPPAPSQPTASR